MATKSSESIAFQGKRYLSSGLNYRAMIVVNVNLVGALPTYGELIDLFQEFGSDQHLLCAEMSRLFPSISINRPGRVVDTITRIVAPTKQSLNGTLKLTGSPLRFYRQRIWEPRVRTARSGGRLTSIAC